MADRATEGLAAAEAAEAAEVAEVAEGGEVEEAAGGGGAGVLDTSWPGFRGLLRVSHSCLMMKRSM